MAALVVSGAPVSVLIDHGLGEKVVEKLLEAGVGTIEKLGSMTPEQLEEISGIGPKTVETIQVAVNSYYAQFEEAVAPEIEPAPEGQESLGAPPEEGGAAPETELAAEGQALPAASPEEGGAAPETEPAAEGQAPPAASPEEGAAALRAAPAAPEAEVPEAQEAAEAARPEPDAPIKSE
jgi:N utilization substance protein A